MNKDTPLTPRESNMGFFFPQPDSLPQLCESDYSKIKFRGKRIDLEVYHLAYGTKKLRACTYRRMAKRQAKINEKKAKQLLVKSPEDKMLKAEKEAWLRNIEAVVQEKNLQIPLTPVSITKGKKGNGKRKDKKKRILKKKILAKQNTVMAD